VLFGPVCINSRCETRPQVHVAHAKHKFASWGLEIVKTTANFDDPAIVEGDAAIMQARLVRSLVIQLRIKKEHTRGKTNLKKHTVHRAQVFFELSQMFNLLIRLASGDKVNLGKRESEIELWLPKHTCLMLCFFANSQNRIRL
jgi:hypothetical protein